MSIVLPSSVLDCEQLRITYYSVSVCKNGRWWECFYVPDPPKGALLRVTDGNMLRPEHQAPSKLEALQRVLDWADGRK
jgi:hypothetical protein